ncbi:MAG: ABC transporter ATP-binding protein [Pirellulales bacterium]
MADLEVQQLTKEFPTRTEPLRVLCGVDLQLDRGQAAAVVGPSGSGKSTLLQILGTLDTPTSGTVRVDGQDPFSLDPIRLAEYRNRRVGFVFQDHHLLPQLTAWENVLIPALAGGRADSATVDRARQLLQEVGLGERLSHRPSELSGGERQRVAIARALLYQPRLLLADEPTGNLDPHTAHAVADLLLQLTQKSGGQTMLIVVTHSRELADRMQQRWQMQDGRLVRLA